MTMSQKRISDYSNLLGRTEMKAIMAGDDLGEVVVHSSYSKVWGTNYSTWLMYNYSVEWQVTPGVVQVPDSGNGGGGGGGMQSDTSIFQHFLEGLGIGLGTNSLTQDAMNLLLDEASMLSRIARVTGIAGLATSAISVIVKGFTTGVESFTINDWLTIGLVVAGGIALAYGAGTAGIIIGLIGLGNDLWSVINPG